jgi:putative ABC transport system substrate-binding protein
MTRLGWVDGRDYVIEAKYADAVAANVTRVAAALVESQPDVILTPSDDAIKAVARATKAIPIVFATASDPVQLGVVKSLQRPGGNVTGLAFLRGPLGAKGAQLLKESFPNITHLGLLYGEEAASIAQAKDIEAGIHRLGIRVSRIAVNRAEDIESGVARAKEVGCDGYVVGDSYVFISQRRRIVDAIAATKLPAVYSRTEYAEAGGLLAYAAPTLENFRHAATYVDKILKGANPADLAIEQPTKFELTVNMKTAKALGLSVSPSVLARADKVIE